LAEAYIEKSASRMANIVTPEFSMAIPAGHSGALDALKDKECRGYGNVSVPTALLRLKSSASSRG